MRTSQLIVLAFVIVPALACAPATRPPETPEPVVRSARAIAALERDDFEEALPDLTWLTSRCEAREHRLRALLLLAAAELDPLNPAASPQVAAGAAATYLLSPDAPAEGRPLARALYRLAADRQGLEPEESAAYARLDRTWPVWLVWLAWPSCSGATGPVTASSLPDLPPTSTAERMSVLEATLASRADSLAATNAQLQSLTSRAAALAERASALEAELARIERVLRDDASILPAGGGHP